jgi:predicted transcriptional regulator
MKIKDLFEGKMTIKKIKQMTSDNFHSEALAAGAEFLGDMELKKELDAVVAQHVKERGLSRELSKKRTELADRLFAKAKQQLSPEEFDKFDTAY